MTYVRISDNQRSRKVVDQIFLNKARVDKSSQEITTGLKVLEPGDSKNSGTIARLTDTAKRLDGYKSRIATVTSNLTYQDDIMAQMNDLIVRAKEVATQGANESNGSERRKELSGEIFQLRDQLVTLGNSQFEGRYLYGGADDDDPPYDVAAPYLAPATGPESVRYRFDAEPGTATLRSVKISDDLTIQTQTAGNTLFDNAINAFERLGRALAGYDTLPAAGTPNNLGAAYTFPTDFSHQTQDIQNSIDLLDTARETDIMPERVNLGGRLQRLQNATSLIELAKTATTEVLDRLQSADISESATELSLAQTALQASYTVSSKILNLSILNFL